MSEAQDLLRLLERRIKAYHGSPHEIKGGFREKGIGNTSFGILGDVEVRRHGIFFSTSKRVARQFGETQPYTLVVNKIANLDIRGIQDQFADSFDPHEERQLWLEAKYAQQVWMLFDDELGERFIPWLERQGYDCACFTEEVPEGNSDDGGKWFRGTTYVVFHNSSIIPPSGQLPIPFRWTGGQQGE